MKAEFFGGPYDGKVLDHNEVNQFTEFARCRLDGGIVHFVLMPPLELWDQIRRGEMPKNSTGDGGKPYPYELCREPSGPKFRDAVQNGRFEEAMKNGSEN